MSDPLLWWNDGLRQSCTDHAEAHYPKEAFGLICGRGDGVHFVPVHVAATSHAFSLDPNRTIHLAYWLRDQDLSIKATFHSHPFGQPALSTSDLAYLPSWADVHVLAVRIGSTWNCSIIRSSSS